MISRLCTKTRRYVFSPGDCFCHLGFSEVTVVRKAIDEKFHAEISVWGMLPQVTVVYAF